MELAEHLTFYADNYKFSPKYRAKMWDGKIRLLNRMTGLVYAGLAQRIKKFCDSRDYTITFDEELYYENVSEHELTEFLNGLNLPDCLSALCLRDRLTHLVTVPTRAVLLGIRLFVILVVADFYCLFFIVTGKQIGRAHV